MGSRLGSRACTVLFLARIAPAALLACGPPPGMCEPDGAPRRIDELSQPLPRPDEGRYYGDNYYTGGIEPVGEGWALFTVHQFFAADGPDAEKTGVRFLGPNLEPLGDTIDLGDGFGARRLWRPPATLGTAEAAYALLREGPGLAIVRAGLDGVVTRQPLVIDARAGSQYGEDLEVGADGRVVALISAYPTACGEPMGNDRRLFLGFEDGRVVGPLHTETTDCRVGASPAVDYFTGHLFPWPDGSFGVVYRRSWRGGAYARFSADGDVIVPTVQVGSFRESGCNGHDFVAARLGEGRVILFQDACGGWCGEMKVINADGSGAHDAWQPPCTPRFRDVEDRIEWVSLSPHPDGATLVWENRNAYLFSPYGTEIREGVFLALIDAGGGQGSPTVRVSSPGASTAQGPIHRSDGSVVTEVYSFRATGFGARGRTWALWRNDLPGLAFRELRCGMP